MGRTVLSGSGNAFAAPGLANAEKGKIKTGLVIEIRKAMRSLQLTQHEASKRMGISQPKVSGMIRGDLPGGVMAHCRILYAASRMVSPNKPPRHHLNKRFTMYIPAHFSEPRPEALHDIIRAHPLGMLVNHGDAGLDADHIPFEFDVGKGPHGILLAHVARANTLWQRCPSGTPVLVVFRGADAYISPNWYPSKHETHRQVPTWNYQVVHAHGTLTVHDDERFVRRLLAQLTRKHEATEPKPWKMGDSAPEYIDAMLRNIVGIEVTITALVGKVKLSQNRELRDRQGAADTLDARGHTAMAQAMHKAD